MEYTIKVNGEQMSAILMALRLIGNAMADKGKQDAAASYRSARSEIVGQRDLQPWDS